jgi:hypothetical protein
MFADHHMLTLFTGLTYVLVPVAFFALGTIVCAVQALVFVILAKLRSHGRRRSLPKCVIAEFTPKVFNWMQLWLPSQPRSVCFTLELRNQNLARA